MKFSKTVICAVIVIAAMQSAAYAGQITLTFERINGNASQNVEGQLSVHIVDSTLALSDYGKVIDSDHVLFAFTNDVDSSGIAANIAEIYLADGAVLGQETVHNSMGGFTNFAGGPANPGNLPGGNSLNPPFVATAEFSADVANGPPANGVNESADILGIVYSTKEYQGQTGIDAIIAALNSGDLRVGLHVRSIGNDGQSDSFVNNPTGQGGLPVPEPASVILLTLGGLGLLGYRRRLRLKQLAA